MTKRIDAARGCVLGALIGDAVGAYLEFIGRAPTPQEIDKALSLPGGGCWRIAPGQITDDGEMTLALGQALIGKDSFPSDDVARNYVRWHLSPPFDIGGTTRAALRNHDVDGPNLSQRMMAQSATNNMTSKANGSLMRASVLGVWSAQVSLEQAIEAARLDAQLTHPNPTCQWAGIAYVAAIRHLMLHPGQSAQAFAAARNVTESASGSDDGAREVSGWLADAEAGRLPARHPMAGFVRIGFTHAFWHLLKETPYEEALRQVLIGGGDTDTNACIVGGLVGALLGQKRLPPGLADIVLNCDTGKGRPRPEWLQARQALDLVAQLIR